MLADSPLVAFVATADAARARAFYEGTLGLRFVSDQRNALVFECAGTTLRVQKVEKVQVVGYTVLGWNVDDIEEAVRELSEVGVPFLRWKHLVQDALGIWTTPGGARVAWFTDPDGNTLSLTQLLVIDE